MHERERHTHPECVRAKHILLSKDLAALASLPEMAAGTLGLICLGLSSRDGRWRLGIHLPPSNLAVQQTETDRRNEVTKQHAASPENHTRRKPKESKYIKHII